MTATFRSRPARTTRGTPLLLMAGALLITTSASAQVQVHNALEKQDPDAQPEPPQWTLHPAPEPDPALRYQLWPDRSETRPGNAMVPIQRAIVIMLEMRGQDQLTETEAYERWMRGPLDELPRDEVRTYLNTRQSTLAELHRARLMEGVEYDLGLTEMRGPDVVSVLLPEFQNMRNLGRLVALEARLALAENRYDDAMRSLQTGFRLAEVAGTASDLIIVRLIGLAIGAVMLEQVEAALQQPDAPNLYWALAGIPPSLWDMQPAIQFEASMLQRMLPALSQIPDESLSDQAWRERLVESVENFSQLGGGIAEYGSDPARSSAAQLYAGLAVIVFSDAARQYLQQSGIEADTVAAMSPSEAIVRSVQRQLASLRSDYFKWSLLPPSLRQQYQGREEQVMKEATTQWQNPAAILYNLLMPAVGAAQRASLRMPQTIAMQATVEALRMHAAESGQFPETLEDLKPVPAWPDPATGQSLSYQRISSNEARISRQPWYDKDPEATVILKLADR